MTRSLRFFWICFLATAGFAKAGEPETTSLILNDEIPALVTPTLDTRFRYEYAEQEGLVDSNAATMRNRVGLLSREVSGFQAFAEYEGILALDRNDYNGGNGVGPAGNTVIADPESHELNQAWISYVNPSDLYSIKAGRQGVNLDDQRHIGTVGWRQNMQTLDAAALTLNPAKDLEIYYGFVWQVNRFFGSETITPTATDFQGQTHLFNAQYKGLPVGTLTTYAYLLDLHNEAGDTNSSNSYGMNLAGDLPGKTKYFLEYSYQTEGAENPLPYSVHYARTILSRELLPGVSGSVGYEYLGSDNGVGYKFPLATLHKFNGYADRFTTTPGGGLNDLYASIGTTVGDGLKLALTYHYFEDDGFDQFFGNEIDLVASKAITKQITALAKGAFFKGENGQPDVTRAIVEINFTY